MVWMAWRWRRRREILGRIIKSIIIIIIKSIIIIVSFLTATKVYSMALHAFDIKKKIFNVKTKTAKLGYEPERVLCSQAV